MKTTDFQGPTIALRKEVLELFILDLCKPIKNIKPQLPIDISILQQPIILENVSQAMLTQHIASGQKIFVAYYRKKPVGYLFATTAQCWVGEIQDSLMVAPKEIYLFNAYVYKKFRSRSIYPALLSHIAQYYKDKSFTNALIFTAQNNIISLKGIKKAGFKHSGDVHFKNFLGRKCWEYSRRKSESKSYFIHEV
jgi:GNAT superfamily N-acetyltransferase